MQILSLISNGQSIDGRGNWRTVEKQLPTVSVMTNFLTLEFGQTGFKPIDCERHYDA